MLSLALFYGIQDLKIYSHADSLILSLYSADHSCLHSHSYSHYHFGIVLVIMLILSMILSILFGLTHSHTACECGYE